MRFGMPLLPIICCLFIALPASAATYYVDATNGLDSAAGTSAATAWRTLGRVNDRTLSPGDTVLLRRGRVWREKLYVDDSGTAAQPITFGAYGSGPDPVLNGADVVPGWQVLGLQLYVAPLASRPEMLIVDGVVATPRQNLAQLLNPGDWLWAAGQLTLFSASPPGMVEATVRQYVTDVFQADHVILQDLSFRYAVDPVRLFNASHLTLERLTVESCLGYSGIFISGFGAGRGQNNVVRNCIVRGMRGSIESLNHANNGAGIFVWGLSTARNNHIEANTVSGNGSSGILIIDAAATTVVENTVDGNGSGGIVVSGLDARDTVIEYNEVFENCQDENDCFGINLYRPGNNNTVRYNTVYEQHVFTDEEVGIPEFEERSGGIRFDGDLNIGVTTTTGNALYGNLIRDEYEGIQIFNYSNVTAYNNTIYNVTRSGIYIGCYQVLNTAEGNRVFNNIFHTAGEQLVWNRNASSTQFDNNIYYPNGSGAFVWNGQRSNFNNWKTNSGEDAASLAVNPQFVNAGAGDFRLSSGSPAINTGRSTPAAPIDLLGVTRPQGSAVDPGAYEYAAFPEASFTAAPRFGAAPLLVQFTDTSAAGTAAISAWSWDFDGDGVEDSVLQHPSHTYADSGEYTVRLRVTTAVGESQTSMTDFINVSSGPNAAFTATPLQGIAPLSVSFTDTSNAGSAAITGWAWDFGNDGTVDSTARNPSHIFAVGVHSVRLTVTDADGEQDSYLAEDLVVADTLPQAAFTADTTSGFVPLPVQFTDASAPGTQPVTDWQWDFGDGNLSSQRNSSHTYTTPGVYTVGLTVTTAAGAHTFTAPAYITAQAKIAPVAQFSATPRSGIAPLAVSFQDESSAGSFPVTAWLWAFGDGATSNDQHPQHTYANSGAYTVSLSVTTDAGVDAITKTEYIDVAAPVGPAADFTAIPASGRAPLLVQFTDTSEPGAMPITARVWNFGDGATSTAPAPLHTYTEPGAYTASLRVTTGIGNDLRTYERLIHVYGVVHVDKDNTSAQQDGTTWTTAYDTIQEGIDEAAALGGGEVWVASGIYAEQRPHPEGALALHEGVEVYGGFTGAESTRELRDWVENPTVVDGSQARAGSPAYHVAIGADAAVLDGFTITGGRATAGTNNRDRGAGIYNAGVSPLIRNCIFNDNIANRSGGAAGNTGGAAPQFINCQFFDNTAQGSFLSEGFGGAVYNQDSSPSFVNCVLSGNSARAALFADGLGGAVYTQGGTVSFINCTIADNRTYGAIFSNGNGGGIYNSAASASVTSSIFWGNIPNQIRSDSGSSTVNFSLVENGQAGTANIALNPQFEDAAQAVYRLLASSPAIDAGTENGAPAADLRGVTRPQGAGIDLGAYEDFGLPVASFSASPLSGAAPLSVTFTDTSTPGSGPIAAWHWDFADGTTSVAQSPEHTYTSPGTYFVTLTVNPGAAQDISDPIEIVVLPGMSLIAHPQGRRAYVGEDVLLEVGVAGSVSPSFQWWFAEGGQKFAITPDGDGAQLRLDNVQLTQAGEYWCEVSAGSLVHVSERALLSVAFPLVIQRQAGGGMAPANKSHVFSIETDGGFAPLQYFWYKDGVLLADAEEAVLQLDGLEDTDTGMYEAQVLDDHAGSVTSDPASLVVTEALPLSSGAGLILLSALLSVLAAAFLYRPATAR